MTRGLSNALANMLEGDNSKLVILVKMFFKDSANTILRLNSSGQSVWWDEAGAGDQEYLGVGNLGAINSAEEGTDIQSYGIQLTLSGIPTDYIQDSVNTDYKNQPVYIYLAALDTDNSVLHDGTESQGPVVLFVGHMDTMSVNLSDTATITVDVISRLRDWERPRGGKFNHHTQKAYYAFLHDGSGLLTGFTRLDRGFEYVDSLKDKEINWGGKAITFSASINTGNGGRGVRGSDSNNAVRIRQ